MKLKHLFAICLTFACSAQDDAYEDEIGTLDEGITAKFVTGYTYGSCGTSTHEKAVTGGGCVGQSILPGKTALKYALSGVDNFPGDIYKSWKMEAKRAFDELAIFMSSTGGGPCSSTPWSFTQVDPVAAHDVLVVPGDCPGDPIFSSGINAFVCVSYDTGALGTGTFVTVTEPFLGGYKRNNGMRVRVVVDMPAILARASNQNFSVHYILEHGTHLAAGIAAGMGTYPESPNTITQWSSPNVLVHDVSGDTFNTTGWTREELCSACSYAITQTPNVFSQQAGVCTN